MITADVAIVFALLVWGWTIVGLAVGYSVGKKNGYCWGKRDGIIQMLDQEPEIDMSELEIVDYRCLCADCQNRTAEVYELSATCRNCGERHIGRFRKGDRPPSNAEC